MSVSQMASSMNELRNIDTEIKRLTQQVKILKEKKKEIEENILEYLNKTDRDALAFKNMMVISKQKKHREKKKKVERENDILNVLQAAGVYDSVKVLDGIKSALRGKEHDVQTLKIKENDTSLYID